MPETDTDKRWAGYTGVCRPEVWNEAAKPPQPTENKIGQITEEQVDKYFREGVLVIEDYFTAEELEPIKKAVEELVDYLTDGLYDAGKLTNKYEEYGLFQRLTMVNKECPGANMLMAKLGMMPQSVRDLWSGEKLCNMVEQLIGGDIGGHPVWNLRTKTPQDEATTVPWHQDCAYLDPESYDKHQPSVWIPLLDATPTNGCMEFAVRGHRAGKIAMHQCCDGDTHYVMLEKEEMQRDLGVDLENDIKVFPVKYGSMLLFNNCIPHRSLNNLSGFPGEIRWSLDLRWQDHKLPWNFHGLAEGIPFRKADDPTWRPSEDDWINFLHLNKDIQREALEAGDTLVAGVPRSTKFSLDSTMTGPWMKNWELSHHNRHTAGVEKDVKFSWHNLTDEQVQY